MIVTFLVAIDLADEADIVGIGEQIQEDLFEDGYEVTSVKPWDRAAVTAQSFLGTPQPQPQGSVLDGTSQLFQ